MNQSIGDTICHCRQDRKMTQEEFASRIGVTPQAVSKWERGNGMPDISIVGDICRILGISPSTLLGIDKGSIVENANIAVEQEIKKNLVAEPLLLEFGAGLIPCVVEGLKTDLVNQKRKELAMKNGMLLPKLRILDNKDFKDKEYRISSYDQTLFSGEMDENSQHTFNQMIERVVEQCERNYVTIINKQIVKTMVDNLKEYYPGVADDVIPEKISYLQLRNRLQTILKERGSIRDLIHIVETMEEEMNHKDLS